MENCIDSEERINMEARYLGIKRIDKTFERKNKRKRREVSLKAAAYKGEVKYQERELTKMSS